MNYQTALAHLHECGILTNNVIMNGQIQRVPTVHKPKSQNGWYICKDDFLIVGDWMTGVTQTFKTGKQKRLNKRDRIDISKAIEKAKLELENRNQDAAILANHLYCTADAGRQHFGYLIRKKVKATPGMRFRWSDQLLDRELLIPLIDLETGEICNLQRITYDGVKRFLKGGRVKGLCFPVNLTEPPNKVLIAEGVATALSLADKTDTPTLAALNASNLKEVAILCRQLWPDADITICGDDDYLTERKTGVNTGVVKAKEAANASNAKISFPPFTMEQKRKGLTDWNDFFVAKRLEGLAK